MAWPYPGSLFFENKCAWILQSTGSQNSLSALWQLLPIKVAKSITFRMGKNIYLNTPRLVYKAFFLNKWNVYLKVHFGFEQVIWYIILLDDLKPSHMTKCQNRSKHLIRNTFTQHYTQFKIILTHRISYPLMYTLLIVKRILITRRDFVFLKQTPRLDIRIQHLRCWA